MAVAAAVPTSPWSIVCHSRAQYHQDPSSIWHCRRQGAGDCSLRRVLWPTRCWRWPSLLSRGVRFCKPSTASPLTTAWMRCHACPESVP